MGQEQGGQDIGIGNKMKVMEMVTTITASLSTNPSITYQLKQYQALVTTLYTTMVSLLQDDNVHGIKLSAL